MSIYDEKRIIYLKLIESGVTKSLLKENEDFILRKKLGYQESNELTFSMIAQLYYEAGYSKNILAYSRMTQIFNKAVFKINRMLKLYGVEQLIYFFSINGLENRKDYIKHVRENYSLKTIAISFLNISLKLENKLKIYDIYNLDDLVKSESYELKRILNEKEYQILKDRLEELSLRFNGIYLNDEKVEKLTDEDKKNINISDLFTTRTSNVLKRHNIYKVKDLLDFDCLNLYSLSNLGKKSCEEIIEKLHILGYELDGEKYFDDYGAKVFCFSDELKKLFEQDKRKLMVRYIFSPRIYRRLQHSSIKTIDDLLKKDCNELMKIRGLGIISIEEIIKIMNALGLHLVGEEKFIENKFDEKIEHFENNDSLKEKISDQMNVVGTKNDMLLEYRRLLEDYKKLKIEEEILDYQITCIQEELSNLQNRSKKYEKM